MFNRLKNVEARYEDINEKLMDPTVVSDNQQYMELMKEHKQIAPVVEKFREYEVARIAKEEAEEMLQDSEIEKDFKEMCEEEISASKESMETLTEELQILLLPSDPDDDKNVIIEIRGGAGGDEAALFANSLYRMYTMYAERKGWKVEVLNSNPTELGGMKEISFFISGEGVYAHLKYESGVHRVQRVPETESQGRVHTSTVTVAVLPEVEDVEIDINPSDLQIDTYRASGAGGQHVNVTDSAVRIIHKPTGVVVECQDERSQHKNRERAMKILRSRLYEKELQEQTDKIASERKMQIGTGDRSERIRTYNYPQGRMTDHRIGLTLYQLESILDGDLDETVEALATADQTAKLEATHEG